jgi:predicted permease
MSNLLVILLVVLGFLLKKLGIVRREIANSLIKLVFYVFLPATLFHSLVRLELETELLLLPAAGMSVALSCYAFAYLTRNLYRMERKTEGSFLIACGAMNQALFSYPFFLLYLGTVGVGYVAFYDVGQALIGLTLGYYIAIKYGSDSAGITNVLNNMLKFPPLWAFTSALLVNYSGFYPSIQAAMPLVELLHNCTTPLIMLSLGIFLEPGIKKINAMLGVIFTRFLFSMIVAVSLTYLFNLSGLPKTTVLIASTVPPAMITLIYSVEENLDVEFTSRLLSICICIGLVYTPLLFTLL